MEDFEHANWRDNPDSFHPAVLTAGLPGPLTYLAHITLDRRIPARLYTAIAAALAKRRKRIQ